jgi:hypothetical protein
MTVAVPGYRRLMTDQDESTGPAPADLGEDDLLRELEQLHRARHETFLHGSDAALSHHNRRMTELEQEYLRRHPQREVDEDRLRSGRRHDT